MCIARMADPMLVIFLSFSFGMIVVTSRISRRRIASTSLMSIACDKVPIKKCVVFFKS